MNKDVMLVTGAGQISMAIARRMGHGKKIVMSSMVRVETSIRICSQSVQPEDRGQRMRWRMLLNF